MCSIIQHSSNTQFYSTGKLHVAHLSFELLPNHLVYWLLYWQVLHFLPRRIEGSQSSIRYLQMKMKIFTMFSVQVRVLFYSYSWAIIVINIKYFFRPRRILLVCSFESWWYKLTLYQHTWNIIEIYFLTNQGPW